MREFLDKLLRASIKLCMLTGVAFTVTACYGVVQEPPDMYEDSYRADQQKVEQILVPEEE